MAVSELPCQLALAFCESGDQGTLLLLGMAVEGRLDPLTVAVVNWHQHACSGFGRGSVGLVVVLVTLMKSPTTLCFLPECREKPFETSQQ